MKKQYVIVKHTAECDLYYNADSNLFSVKHPTIFTNKKIASQKMQYADKYASGCELAGKTEVMNLYSKKEDIDHV